MILKGTQEGWGWRFSYGMWHKKFETKYRVFEPYLPIVPVKVECLSAELFWMFKRLYKTNKLG